MMKVIGRDKKKKKKAVGREIKIQTRVITLKKERSQTVKTPHNLCLLKCGYLINNCSSCFV